MKQAGEQEKKHSKRSLQDIKADFLRRDNCCSSWITIKKVTCSCWDSAKIYFNHAAQRENTQIHPENFKLISAQFLQYSSGSLRRIGLTMEMFWENLILCPGRFHTLFISCWTLLYAEEHVGIVVVKSGCSSLLARGMAKAGACIWVPSTSALLTGKLILVSFAVFLVRGSWFFLCPSFTVFSPLTYGLFKCLSSCWIVLSLSLQGKILIYLMLKQLPRQELQRTVHVCFGTVVKCPYFISCFEK